MKKTFKPQSKPHTLDAPPRLFLLSVKKGEAQTLLLQSSSNNKIQPNSNQDLSSSYQLVSKQNTQTVSNETYLKEPQTNNQTTISGKNIQKLDISFGKELQSDNSQTVQSCDMRQARLRQKQQNNLKDIFQKAMASLDRKLSAHDHLETQEKKIKMRVQNSDNNQKENKENTRFNLMEDYQSIKSNQNNSNRQQNHSEHIINMQQGRCVNTEDNPTLQELKWQQNLSKESSKNELKLNQQVKDRINKNKSISLLSQSLMNRMQQREGELVRKEQGGKQTKRVSWESQEDINSNEINKSCQLQNNQSSQKQFMLIQNKHNQQQLQNDIHSIQDLGSSSAVFSKQNSNKKHNKKNMNQDSQFNHQNQDSSNISQQIPLSIGHFQLISQQDQQRSNSVAVVAFKDNEHTSHNHLSNSRSISDAESLKYQQTAHKFANTQTQNLLQFSRNQYINGNNPLKYINSLNSSVHYYPAQIKEVFLKQQNPYNPEGTLPTSLSQVSYNMGYATRTSSAKDSKNAPNSHKQKFKQLRRSIRSAVQISNVF